MCSAHTTCFVPFYIFSILLVFFFPSRFLLKLLLQYQSLSDGEIPTTLSSSCHPPVPPVALTPSPAGASGLSGGPNHVSVMSTGDDGPPKKSKKERKERGRENGKEDCEYSCQVLMLVWISTREWIVTNESVSFTRTSHCWNTSWDEHRQWFCSGIFCTLLIYKNAIVHSQCVSAWWTKNESPQTRPLQNKPGEQMKLSPCSSVWQRLLSACVLNCWKNKPLLFYLLNVLPVSVVYYLGMVWLKKRWPPKFPRFQFDQTWWCKFSRPWG